MKSRFEFFYVCKGVEFEDRCEFRGVLTGARSESSSPSKRVPFPRAEVRVSLEPLEKEDTKRFIDGRLLVTLPGRPEEVEPLAFSLAADLSNLINFVHGPTFELQAGLITAERVPETPEEEAEIGDKRYWAVVNLEQVPEHVVFDRPVLNLLPAVSKLRGLIAQFNVASRAVAPVDQYLGFYKVIETIFRRARGDTKTALKGNSVLRSLIRDSVFKVAPDKTRRSLTEPEIENLIEDIVSTRDKCAHLREGFGLSPVDPEVQEKVRPLLSLVRGLALDATYQRLEAASPAEYRRAFGSTPRAQRSQEAP